MAAKLKRNLIPSFPLPPRPHQPSCPLSPGSPRSSRLRALYIRAFRPRPALAEERSSFSSSSSFSSFAFLPCKRISEHGLSFPRRERAATSLLDRPWLLPRASSSREMSRNRRRVHREEGRRFAPPSLREIVLIAF